MAASTATTIVCIACYAYFFVLFVLYVGWLLPGLTAVVPRSIAPHVSSIEDSRVNPNALTAFATDTFLVSLFALPHSFFARDFVKEAIGLGDEWYRPLYILLTTATLQAHMHFWQSFDASPIWDAQGTSVEPLIAGFFLFGFLFLLSATFALDHFNLFGLSQGIGLDINKALGLNGTENDRGMVVRLHYSLVAHPIMTGFLVISWSATVMSASRLLFAVLMTSYIVFAVKMLEEPDLERKIGSPYTEYLATVPSFCPFAPPSSRRRGPNKSTKIQAGCRVKTESSQMDQRFSLAAVASMIYAISKEVPQS
uniref:Nuclear envelope membrane protein n=1 Tax=Lotharella globosa TaxID=91324 RepID=A0A7S4DLD3_9EUKA